MYKLSYLKKNICRSFLEHDVPRETSKLGSKADKLKSLEPTMFNSGETENHLGRKAVVPWTRVTLQPNSENIEAST